MVRGAKHDGKLKIKRGGQTLLNYSTYILLGTYLSTLWCIIVISSSDVESFGKVNLWKSERAQNGNTES